MSHSQFHSINLFTLRHAWLNLWDKHMTTGRINQVSIFAASGDVIPCDPLLSLSVLFPPLTLEFQIEFVILSREKVLNFKLEPREN